MTETTTPAPAPPSPAPSRGLKIAFAVSLALNLAIAGLAAGAWLRDGGPGRGMPRDFGFGPFTGALSADDRHALREAIRKEMPTLRAEREAAKAEFAALLAALRADPYDPDAVASTLTNIATRAASRLTMGQGLLESRIGAMSVAERLAFADRLEAGLRHRSRD